MYRKATDSSNPTVWLTGCKGLLGNQIADEFEKQGVVFTGSDVEVDIGNRESVHQFSKKHSFDWIVNCAAYTQVEKAEDEQEKAFRSNVSGIENLAEISDKYDIPIIHFSTDYVFDGKGCQPYKEKDLPSPASIYGKSKLEGEKKLASLTKKFFIFRISWLYGFYGKNFVKTMLDLIATKKTLDVVNDQNGSPTYAAVLAFNIVQLIKNDRSNFGIYHYSDEGNISWYDFACKIKELAFHSEEIDNYATIVPVSGKEYITKAARPAYSCFNKEKVMKELGFRINHWEENLRDFLSQHS